jgi:D-xylose transport system permease protein
MIKSMLSNRLYFMVFVIMLLWAVFGILTNGLFLTPRNLFNLSLQVSVVGIMASGMVLLIVARQIDLSVGSQLGLISVLGAMIQTQLLDIDGTHTWWIAIAMMLVLGTTIGAMQGFLVGYGGIPSFIVTLGGLMFFRNLAFYVNGGSTISPLNETFRLFGGGISGTIGPTMSWILAILSTAVILFVFLKTRRQRELHGISAQYESGSISLLIMWILVIFGFVWVMNSYTLPRTGEPAGIAIPFLILVGGATIMTLIARNHVFGEHVYSYGGNPEAAALSGINTKMLVVKVFAIMGFLSGLAAVVVSARLNSAASITGTNMELNVIAAAIIGGTSLAGGIGTIVGAVLGALIMQTLENGMILLGVSTPFQKMFLALVLVAAVWVDPEYRKKVTSNE